MPSDGTVTSYLYIGNNANVMQDSWQLYRSRIEPAEVKDGREYLNVRTCTDVERLQRLEATLRKHHQDAVLVPWISPPFGVIKGYGIYARREAERLQHRAEREGWGFPRPGKGYDLEWFCTVLGSLQTSQVSSSR